MDYSFLVWNCEDAAKTGFRCVFKSFVKIHKHALMALLESRTAVDKANKVIKNYISNSFIELKQLGSLGEYG